LPVDTRHKVTYIHDMYFSHICHFRPMTQPNPLKTQIFDPFPTQPNPRVNPTHGQLWTAAFRHRAGKLQLGSYRPCSRIKSDNYQICLLFHSLIKEGFLRDDSGSPWASPHVSHIVSSVTEPQSCIDWNRYKRRYRYYGK